MSEEEDDPGPLTIDIVGDVTCPWCFLGKRLVDAVVGSVPGLAVELRWYPFLIDPALPAGRRRLSRLSCGKIRRRRGRAGARQNHRRGP